MIRDFLLFSENMDFSFDGVVSWPSSATVIGEWYFVAVPKHIAHPIREVYKDRKYKWVEIPIQVQIAFVKWETRMFWLKQLQSYIIPLKKDIREKLSIDVNDKVFVEYDII